MTFITKYFWIFCVFLLMGCATTSENKQQDLFKKASHVYQQAIMHSKFAVANGLRKVHASDTNTQHIKNLKTIKVTSYELLSIKVSKDSQLVNQKVEIQYYNLDHMIEKTIVDDQLWKYYPEEKTWYLQSDLPDFK